ncbi:MAG: VWA domain-containing protein [Bacteroidota bacterium]
MNQILALIRGVLVSLLCLLLLNFFIKKTDNKVQKKLIGILFDNSKSINAIGQNQINGIKNALSNLKNTLNEKDFEVEIGNFSDEINIDSIKNEAKTTNLSALLSSFKSKNEGRNITDIILISDGINNQGVSPSNLKYPFPIHTIAVGDSVPKRDVILRNIISNKIAYQGNEFVVQAEVQSVGYDGKSTTVSISQDNKIIQSKAVSFKNSLEPVLVEFKINSTKKGINRFLVHSSQLSGEFNIRNNTREVFIEIIDGQQKILILAPAPHPDIKALKAIIENNENYKLTIGIANQTEKIDFNQKFDLVILHQLPDELGSFEAEIKQLKKNNNALFYIIGNLSSIAAINLYNNDLQIEASSFETDKVNGALNENYSSIDFDKNSFKLFEKLPPIIVPFGEYKTKNEIILFQKIGNTLSKKPLLIVNNKYPKSAYFMGEGLWAWRMDEYAQTDKNEVVDELFTKVIQLVSTKEDTRKLRIYPTSRDFDIGQPVILETEVYNDIYQKTFNNKINLQVIDEKKVARKYQFTNLEGNSSFQITGLPQGIYNFVGSTEISGKSEVAAGEFIVKSVDFEMENLQADFNELQKIAKNSGGDFYKVNEIGALQQKLLSKNYVDKIVSEESLDELINWQWFLFALILLATIEWASRKYLGGY